MSEKSKRQERAILWVFNHYPEVKGSNTELYIKMLELSCKKRGVTVPAEIKQFMREHKPEQIVRMRRKLVNSTQGQREEEQKYRQEYGKSKKNLNLLSWQ